MSADGPAITRLDDGWEIASSVPDACPDPVSAAAQLTWTPAAAIGAGGGLTAALAVGENGQVCSGRDYDAEDWWFRVRVDAPPAAAGEELVLRVGGLATLATVWVDGAAVLSSDSMYTAHDVTVDEGIGELVICCRALAPRLQERRRPRARWRTRLADGGLRFWRTMLLGRAPGFAPGPAVVGPWRPVTVERRRGVVVESLVVRSRIEGRDGVLTVSGRLRSAGGPLGEQVVTVGTAAVITQFGIGPDGRFAGELPLADVTRWWPHTHGEPVLHDVTVHLGDSLLARRRVGFRELSGAIDLEADGPALRVNGVEIFCRGAVWTPLSLVDPHGDPETLRAVLTLAVQAGLNLIRVCGTGCYESAEFHDLCDELGLLVWQDLMFANLDYPESDPEFRTVVEAEVRAQLAAVAWRPSLAVVCGGSEVAQQVAMMGLDPALASGPLYGELLPRLCAEASIDGPYLPSAPWGGPLPFRTDRGVANYFGVGAYLRPLEDARRAEVRFASECLAFANVGDGPVPADGVLGRGWKAGVPRDVGAGWDFDDVRDHYLGRLYGVDPVALRYAEPERYLALSREVSGEVMAETFGEWRRAASPCSGAIVLWLKDVVDGAGWGLIDAGGMPKVALHHLRRALAPTAVWTTDEGLGGIDIHLANDGPRTLAASLRVALYRDGAVRVEEATMPIELPAHGVLTIGVEEVLGRFVDVSWAYRFGPPVADVVVVSLEGADGALLAQAVRFPAGHPLAARSASELGLTATLVGEDGGRAVVRVRCERLVWGVRLEVPGWAATDDAFSVEPGHLRCVTLRPVANAASSPDQIRGRISALNLSGSVAIRPPQAATP